MKDWINKFVNETGTVSDSSVTLGSDRLILATETISLSSTTSGGSLGLFLGFNFEVQL